MEGRREGERGERSGARRLTRGDARDATEVGASSETEGPATHFGVWPSDGGGQRRKPDARRRPVEAERSPGAESSGWERGSRGEGGRPNSSEPHCTAASGAERQNSGSSDRGRPRMPSTCVAKFGAQPANTRKFCRCKVTERNPTVRQSMLAACVEDPESSAAARTALFHH